MHSIFFIPILLVTFFSHTTAWAQQPGQAGSNFTISANVELVMLDVSVKDKKGGYVSDLAQEHFQIFDNGKLQSIRHFSRSDLPITVGLVLDNSGSMGPKRGEVMAAALAFISASNPKDEIFVVNFNDKVVPGLPPDVLFTNNQQILRQALLRASSEGRTALNDAVGYSVQYLNKGSMDKKALLVVSDGGDNASDISASEVAKQAYQSHVTIYTIGIFNENDPDSNPRFLRKLARISGGEYFQLRNLPEIVPVCRRIADDIRNRYTIAYRPPHTNSRRSEHSIKVVASMPSRGRLNVLTRTRYDMPEARRLTPVEINK